MNTRILLVTVLLAAVATIISLTVAAPTMLAALAFAPLGFLLNDYAVPRRRAYHTATTRHALPLAA